MAQASFDVGVPSRQLHCCCAAALVCATHGGPLMGQPCTTHPCLVVLRSCHLKLLTSAAAAVPTCRTP